MYLVATSVTVPVYRTVVTVVGASLVIVSTRTFPLTTLVEYSVL